MSPYFLRQSSRGFCSQNKPEEKAEEKKEETPKEQIKARRENERRDRKKESSKLNKVIMKLKSIQRDMQEILGYIKNRDFAAVMWRTKEFVARFYRNFKHIMRHLWLEIKKIGRGFKSFKEDLTYSIKTTKDTTFKEYGTYSFESRVRIRQTWSDLFKFVPFSIFILIPGLELLLPAWLVIFPNAIPSQFQSDSSKEQKLEKLVQLQQSSSEKLVKMIPKILTDLSRDREVLPEDQEKIKKLKSMLKDPDVISTDLLDYRELFAKYINFKYTSPKTILSA